MYEHKQKQQQKYHLIFNTLGKGINLEKEIKQNTSKITLKEKTNPKLTSSKYLM